MELEPVDPRRSASAADAAGIELRDVDRVRRTATDPTSRRPEVRRAARRLPGRCVDATADMGGAGARRRHLLGARRGGSTAGRTRAHFERAADVLPEVARHAAGRGVPRRHRAGATATRPSSSTPPRRRSSWPSWSATHVGVHLDAYHMNIEEDEFAEPVRRGRRPALATSTSREPSRHPGRGRSTGRPSRRARRVGYDGYVGLESFVEMSPSMRAATCIWRDLARAQRRAGARGARVPEGASSRRDRGGGCRSAQHVERARLGGEDRLLVRADVVAVDLERDPGARRASARAIRVRPWRKRSPPGGS